MLLESGLDNLESRLPPARGQLSSHPWTYASRPWATSIPPTGCPHPARSEILPGVTLGALFHGLSHVLREVPQVSPALDKVPKRATMSGCAVTHTIQWIHLQRPTTQTKHTPQGTIALAKSQSTANRSYKPNRSREKISKGQNKRMRPRRLLQTLHEPARDTDRQTQTTWRGFSQQVANSWL